VAQRRRENDVRGERGQFGRVFAHGFGIAETPAIVDADILSHHPAQLLQTLREGGQPGLCFRIVRRKRCEDANARNPPTLLRMRHDRPRSSRAAEQRDEIAALHSITSSARASSVGGIVRPIVFAVCKLMTNSNLVGCTTGRSAGLVPLRMRPV
jgi:hypothetical protein